MKIIQNSQSRNTMEYDGIRMNTYETVVCKKRLNKYKKDSKYLSDSYHSTHFDIEF